MSAVIPHYKSGCGPMNKQVATLIYGGQLVQPNTLTAGTTDLTVTLALSASVNVLGVAGADGNVVSSQTAAANAYGQPAIDISVLQDYIPVYYGDVDIWVWYAGAVIEGTKIKIGGGNNGTVITSGAGPAADQVVGMCTHPGGVAAGMLTQQIGGQGSASYFLGRARIF
jgi:hypothetical protein